MRLPRSIGILSVFGSLVLLIGLLVYGQASTGTDRSIDEALIQGKRKPAPDKRLERLDVAGTGSLADYRGKVVVVNFWASWCGPCREEAPTLQRFWEEYRDRGVVMLGINSMDLEGDARRFVRQYHQTYPMLRDPRGERRRAWGLTGFPETFVVDRQGRIAAIRRGKVDRKLLEGMVEPVLEERS